jgi:hypothetical protein
MKATPRYDRPGDLLEPVPPALVQELNAAAAAYDRERAGGARAGGERTRA